MSALPEPRLPPRKLASAYFLGFVFVVLAVALWMRGAGRFLLPLLLVGVVVVIGARIVRKIREPLP